MAAWCIGDGGGGGGQGGTTLRTWAAAPTDASNHRKIGEAVRRRSIAMQTSSPIPGISIALENSEKRKGVKAGYRVKGGMREAAGWSGRMSAFGCDTPLMAVQSLAASKHQ
jgi:hypothetical protein